jgi:hypothetical protein
MSRIYGIKVRVANVTELNAINYALDYNTFADCNVRDDIDSPIASLDDDIWYVDEKHSTAYCLISAKHSSNGKWVYLRELRYGRHIEVANIAQ